MTSINLNTIVSIIKTAEGKRASFNECIEQLRNELPRAIRNDVVQVRAAIKPAIAKLYNIAPNEDGTVTLTREHGAARQLVSRYAMLVVRLGGESSPREVAKQRVPRECATAVAALVEQFGAKAVREALRRA